MTRKNGFTLIELMVVVSLVILLLAWGIPSFSNWRNKRDVEGEIYNLYSNLQNARMNAYGQKIVTGVWWGGGASISSYQVRTDGNNDGNVNTTGVDPQMGATVTLKAAYPIIPVPSTQSSVSFDGKGFLNSTAVSFRISSTTGVTTDCVAVNITRITLGKWNAGTSTCQPK